MDNIATMEGQSKEVRDLLLSIKSNNNRLFSAIEQGSGKNDSKLLVVSSLQIRMEARKWILKNYRTKLKINNKQYYNTSIPP